MFIILAIAILIAVLTIGSGFTLYFSDKSYNHSKVMRSIKASAGIYGAFMLAFMLILIPDMVSAWAGETEGTGLAFIAAGLSTGLATLGAGYAVGAVGSSALGAVSENPKILGKTLIFVGLAEGIAIYGLITSILILGRL
jgi:V/A-type H+-transporting ATPase subunit K